MILKNKLDKSFGPTGTAAGFLLFIVGLITLIYTNVGLILFLLGAFIAFTSTSSKFDTEHRRIKFSENLFGIFPQGRWIEIEPEMTLGLSNHSRGFQVLSRSNKSLDLKEQDVRIALYDANHEKIMDIKKFKSRDLAEQELHNFVSLFEIEILQPEEKALVENAEQ